MSSMFDKLVEEKIQEAIRNGVFDNLPLKGKPVNLDYWASLPADIRAGYMLLKDAGYAPEEVHLLKEIGELREQLKECVDPDLKVIISKKLQEAKLKYNLIIDLIKHKHQCVNID